LQRVERRRGALRDYSEARVHRGSLPGNPVRVRSLNRVLNLYQ
jgi:hypothetical protein